MTFPKIFRIAAGAAFSGLMLAAAVLPSAAQAPTADALKSGPLVHVTSSLALPELAREVPFVVLTPEADAAQVRVEITSAGTPSGEDFTIALTGQGAFEGQNNILKYAAPAGTAPAAIRRELVRMLKLGLVRYALKTPAASRLNLSFQGAVKPTAVSDPWDFWVFSLGLNGFVNGEKTYSSQMWNGNLSAQRVTPEWKVRTAANAVWQKSSYDIEGYAYESRTTGQTFNGVIVRSLGEHWSVGAFLKAESSTFSNLALLLQATPALEYDLFPYSESTKKQLRILYTVGPKFGRYREETIYDKMKETLWGQSLAATLELNQGWGTLSATLEGSHYFHDLSKNRLSLNAEISFRVFKGLNFNLDGGGSRIRDQLALPKGGATLEEVLLRRQQIATTYDYFFMAGFSLSFGSVNSNVVNPRFGSGSGNSMMIRF